MILALALGVVGIVVGPWLGVVVDRAVERERLIPTHRCPRCRTSLGARSMIPVRSWFLACPVDPSHPRWRYPTTDLVVAASFAVAGWRFGATWQLWPYLAVFAVLAVLLTIDLEHHLLLDVLTLPLLGATAFAVLVLSGPNDYADGVWPALTGALVLGGFFLAAFLAYPPGMGFGDVKLAPTLGLAMGWLSTSLIEATRTVIYGAIVSFMTAAVVGLAHRWWVGRRDGDSAVEPASVSMEDDGGPAHDDEHPDWVPGEIPLGPFLVLGTVVMVAVTSPAALGR